MMPKLPPPCYSANGLPWFDDAQMLDYGRAVAEACAVAVLDAGGDNADYHASAIREAAKETGK